MYLGDTSSDMHPIGPSFIYVNSSMPVSQKIDYPVHDSGLNRLVTNTYGGRPNQMASRSPAAQF